MTPRLKQARAIIAKFPAKSVTQKSPVRIGLIGVLDAALERAARGAIETAHRERREIDLIVDSGGGSADAGRNIALDIEASKVLVVATAGRLVGSAAVSPFLAAEDRRADLSSKFYFHSAWLEDPKPISVNGASADKLRRIASELDGFDLEMLHRLGNQCRLGRDVLSKARTAEGVTLSSRLAASMGIVTHLTPGLSCVERFRLAQFHGAPIDCLAQFGLAWRGVRS